MKAIEVTGELTEGGREFFEEMRQSVTPRYSLEMTLEGFDRPMNYRLDENRNPIATDNPLEWNRVHVARNTIRVNRYRTPQRGGYRKRGKTCSAYVSTVFLGIDHNYSLEGPPVLFETMIFVDGPLSEFQERYCTWEEAKRGHERALRKLRNVHQGGRR
jgi:hypothetical protein